MAATGHVHAHMARYIQGPDPISPCVNRSGFLVGQHMYSILNWASIRAWLPMSVPYGEVQLATLKTLGLMGVHQAELNMCIHGLAPFRSMRVFFPFCKPSPRTPQKPRRKQPLRAPREHLQSSPDSMNLYRRNQRESLLGLHPEGSYFDVQLMESALTGSVTLCTIGIATFILVPLLLLASPQPQRGSDEQHLARQFSND